MRILAVLLTTLVFTNALSAQTAIPRDTSCTGSVIVEYERDPNLNVMVRRSDVILIGAVVEVVPPVNVDPSPRHLQIETESVVSVEQLLSGSVGNAAKIVLAQIGGNIPPYNQSVAGDPIVKEGERYVLFLRLDNRKLPTQKPGLARFISVGVGDGMVKIVDGKVQISCAATPELKKYHNSDFAAFVSTVRDMVALAKPLQR